MIERETPKAMSIAYSTTVFIFGIKNYILADPDDCLTVGNACLEKHKFYSIARSCFGDGLVTASTETWKEHRKLLNPKFSLNYLLSLLGVFNKQARDFVKEFETHIDNGEFDHGYFIRHNEMRTICLTSIGLDLTNDKETLNEYENAFLTILNSYIEQFVNLWLHFKFFWRRSRLRIIRNTNRDIMHRTIDKIVERKNYVYDNEINSNSDEAGHFKPFLDVLFDVKNTVGDEVMNDKFIRDHVNTLIFAGHDTITLVMQVVMIVIGSYPAVQDKLYSELQEVFGGSDRDVEKDDLTKLIYMDAVLKETMRLYPIVPFLGRYVHRDIKLKNVTLKGGHSCFLSVYAVNRHPMWGRDADHFRPERWLDRSTLPSNPNAFMAFSIGKRNCIGRTYSMISMKTTLAHILRRYRINADLKKLEFKFEVLLTPAAGHYISIARRKPRPNQEPPVLKGALPLVGHAHMLIGDSNYNWKMVMRWSKECLSIGGSAIFYICGRKYYVLTDPDDCLTVANACLNKDIVYKSARSCFGDGLVTAPTNVWKGQRKLLNPTFCLTHLLSLLGVFNKQSRILLEEFESQIGKEFDHGSIIRHNEMKTICFTSLGLDYSNDKDTLLEFANAFDIVMNCFTEHLQKFWYQIRFIWRRSDLKRKRDTYCNIMSRITDTIIKKRRADHRNKIVSGNHDEGTNFKPFLDVLFELKETVGDEVMSDKLIRDHVNTLIMAGHDTVTNALQITLILIGSYPKVQDKIYAELQEVFGNSDRDVEKDDLRKLIYLEAVLKEAMRLYTIVPITSRHLHQDVKLKNYTLQRGNSCILFYMAVHRHSMWGPDAEHFKPERWLDPNTLPSNPNAFIAFSLGKRNCIGRTYAMISMKTTLAHILRRYRIHANDNEMRFKLEFLLKPSAGYLIKIERR
ncbi:PREDICTED: cytochrome P450 4V2-like [Papilio polytes]|uniref:cytochrome P450 4V2-like n=1 Tax=Papilio polytes TaxID=76194 RepID=UPI000676AD85|nr:PREDICTED: cytochrome P450 4V2-like [Papilio polytes]